MTRSRQRGKQLRIEGAIKRAHEAMVSWYTQQSIKDKAVADAKAAGQPRPSMYVGKQPAPVVWFIPMSQRRKALYCRGHHVNGGDCSIATS